jgi:hypothetical protein
MFKDGIHSYAHSHTLLCVNSSTRLACVTLPQGRAMAQAVSRRALTAEARVRSRGQSMWDLWWTNWHWDMFLSEYFGFPCQYHSTGAPLNWKSRNNLVTFVTRLHNKPSRLRCVRSVCCGALQ